MKSAMKQKKCNCLAISLFYIFGLFPLQRNVANIAKGKRSKSLSLTKKIEDRDPLAIR